MNADLALCRQCHCLAARRAARAITRHYEAGLRRHGLRATQFSILAALAIGGPKPLGRLAQILGLERTTLTRGAALMERDGWVRTEESADGRARPLRLTAAGRRKLEQAYPAWKAAQESAAAKFADALPATAGHAARGKRDADSRPSKS
jgi:DNA-binding MarR family transcriptional regulator